MSEMPWQGCMVKACTRYQVCMHQTDCASQLVEKVGDPNIKSDDWTPDERTVRACIEALPPLRDDPLPHSWAYFDNQTIATCHEALEALLPKPDPIEALLEEWTAADAWACGTWTPLRRETAERLLAWLIDTGRIKP